MRTANNMAEVPNQAEIDKVISEGGSALDEALKSALDSAEGTAPAAAVQQEAAEEDKGDQSDADKEDEAEETEDSSVDEDDKSESKEEIDETEDDKAETSKEAKDGDDRSKNKHESRAAKKARKLLDQRNSARDEAAKALKDAEAKDKRIAELEAALEKRGEKPTEEVDDSETDDADDDTEDDLDTKIEKAIDKRTEASERNRRKADLDKQERDALVSKYKPTAEELQEVDEIIKRHPTLSDVAALRIAAPHHFTDAAIAARANAKKQAVGASAQRNLREERSPADMSNEELEKHLKSEHQAGRLAV